MPLLNFRSKTKGQGKHGLNLPPTNNTGEELETLLSEIGQLGIGSRNPSDISRQVMLCQTALGLVSSAVHPIQWAALQGLLAMSLHENPLGERADNLEQAISHYEQALQVLTPQAFPEDWASTQTNLGNAYRERIRGEPADVDG